MKKIYLKLTLILVTLVIFSAKALAQTENVFIIVMDGVRYSEHFGAKDKYIPNIWNRLRPQGLMKTNFWIAEEKQPKTLSGHPNLLTGVWHKLPNLANMLGWHRPHAPTIFEYYRKHLNKSKEDALMISGKWKLQIGSHSRYKGYGADYRAWQSTVNRSDNETVEEFLKLLEENKPSLGLLNLADTDRRGHTGNWKKYLEAIKEQDRLIYKIWTTLQSLPKYKDKTTVFIVTDHGRHLDHVKNGFIDHGNCDCDGCRHLMFLALGPEIPQNMVDTTMSYQIDMAKTVASLLGFPTPHAQGRALVEIFAKDNRLAIVPAIQKSF